MSGPVTYRRGESIAVITMDDGKVNALGPTMQQALNEALDDADRDEVGALVIAGNQRVFSAGFDLKILTAGEVRSAIDMLRGGFELSHRLLSYPKPVVMACTGPAIAMGSFLLCSGDHRIAAPGYTIQANEVAIGMVLPHA
ncbi:MAG TPA: crotonase/enoyl-CoA hydratase family protein, partial [Mycobacterium sp.]|nr:crotonase/enoyl-CoA hydratase family protein [Mycobacterium sp.]